MVKVTKTIITRKQPGYRLDVCYRRPNEPENILFEGLYKTKAEAEAVEKLYLDDRTSARKLQELFTRRS